MGKYLSIWGVKAIFPAGFIIDGGTFILFGMLQWVNDTTMFLVFSYLIRFLEVRVFFIQLLHVDYETNFEGSRSRGHMDVEPFHPYGEVPREEVDGESLV